jgi:hypothetical protein
MNVVGKSDFRSDAFQPLDITFNPIGRV